MADCPPFALLRRCAALLALVSIYGCAGDGPSPQEISGEFAQLQRNIFNQHCLAAGCHNSQSQGGGLDLSDGVSYDELVNVVPENPAAASAGLLRVEPFDAQNSFLLIKLTGPGAGQGARMPQGMNPLAQSDIDAIRQWILDGAPRGNSTAVPTASATPVPTDTAPPTETPPPSVTHTPTISPTAANTATATITVTGTAPATSTPTATATITETPSPSPTPTATATPGLFAQIQTTIFNQRCIDAFCHDLRGQSGGLVLIEGQSYAELVGVQPENVPARDEGLLRVEPFDPDNSFLVIKVEGPTNPAMGLRMPSGGLPLTAEQIQLIRDWIQQGATE
jgi:hypothetical protein